MVKIGIELAFIAGLATSDTPAACHTLLDPPEAARTYDLGQTQSTLRSTKHFNPSVTLDLGSLIAVAGIALSGFLNHVREYEVEVSEDGKSWKQVGIFQCNKAALVTNMFATEITRYVKIVPSKGEPLNAMRVGVVKEVLCADMCTAVRNPPESARTYSSISRHEKSQLNSTSGWSAEVNDMHQYMILDLGSLLNVAGIVSQGYSGSTAGQFVKQYKVNVSRDANQWEDMGKFDCDSNSACENTFTPVYARYVKIMPLKWHYHIIMRAGVVVKTPCEVCKENFHVSFNNCVRCPSGTTRMAGDIANEEDTTCIAFRSKRSIDTNEPDALNPDSKVSVLGAMDKKPLGSLDQARQTLMNDMPESRLEDGGLDESLEDGGLGESLEDGGLDESLEVGGLDESLEDGGLDESLEDAGLDESFDDNNDSGDIHKSGVDLSSRADPTNDVVDLTSSADPTNDVVNLTSSVDPKKNGVDLSSSVDPTNDVVDLTIIPDPTDDVVDFTSSVDAKKNGVDLSSSVDPKKKGVDHSSSVDPKMNGVDLTIIVDPKKNGVDLSRSVDPKNDDFDLSSSVDPKKKGVDLSSSVDPTNEGVDHSSGKIDRPGNVVSSSSSGIKSPSSVALPSIDGNPPSPISLDGSASFSSVNSVHMALMWLVLIAI